MPNCSSPAISPIFIENISFYTIMTNSVIMSILTYYIILTKSSLLGRFKYYLLYQTVCAQLLEITIVAVKPVVLTPYLGGFTGGILRNILTYDTFLISVWLGYCTAGTCIISAALSVIYRFFFIFQPHNRKYLENKYNFVVIFTGHIAAYCIFAYFILIDKVGQSALIPVALNNSGTALVEYFFEPGFAIFSEHEGIVRWLFKCIFYFILAISTAFLGSIVFAIVSFFVSHRSKITITRTTRSLLMTSLSQATLCVIFLNGPSMLVIGTWGWNVPNSNFAANIAMNLVSLYATFDRISTLCFVAPYRKFIISKLNGVIPCRSHPKIRVMLSGQVSWHGQIGGMAKVKHKKKDTGR
uniref:Serpentine Receptor, class T n=1 Tax=Panagrellus redivivus TaxID=6233 RepID=A0A7E4VWQ9_PANRE